MQYYQDKNLYYFRKPAGIPSTFWKEKSFVELLLDAEKGENKETTMIPTNIVASLSAFFWTEKELWLLNRLDNDTSGLLYFAKNPRVYTTFRQMQSERQLEKWYVAEVYGDISQLLKAPQSSKGHYSHQNGQIKITTPLAHHRYNTDRMVAIVSPSDIKKTKWTVHHLTTTITEFQFLPATRTSILLIKIHKGLRHQIRAHLASVGHPICGDRVYVKSSHQTYDKLQLFSVGLTTSKEI